MFYTIYMIGKRFLLTIITLLVIAVAGFAAAYFAKGYRVSSSTGGLIGTGIISVTSIPDQASVYLDNALITATNANISSLEPKEYQVRIVKDGFIPWEKKLRVKEGFVTDIKATLFPALPSVYPLTYKGVVKPQLSNDGQKLAFVIPGSVKKNGIWVWTMKDSQIGFARGGEPHQILAPLDGVDLSAATLQWSADSKQLLASVGDRNLLLDDNSTNDNPKDITPLLQSTQKQWADDDRVIRNTKLEAIKDGAIRKVASDSAYLKFSPDETKFLYSTDGKTNFKTVDIKTNQTYDLPAAYSYSWLPDSLHIVIVDAAPLPVYPVSGTGGSKTATTGFGVSKISIIEYEGFNKAEIFAGNFDPASVFAWPDSSRVVMLYSLPTTTGSVPNLYGINLK